MGDGYTDAEGRPISGMPHRAMEAEHARRMLRTRLYREPGDDRVSLEVWQTGGNYTDRLVCIADNPAAADEIIHRWNSYGYLLSQVATPPEEP